MTEASEGVVRHTLAVHAQAHSGFLLVSGTASLTSTSSHCSCFCSKAGQSKRAPVEASDFKPSQLMNHQRSSISMLRMGWTCWQSSSSYFLETCWATRAAAVGKQKPVPHVTASSQHPEAHASCHSPTTALWCPVLDGIRFSYASFLSLSSTATSSSTKTEFSSLPFLTRGSNSLALRTEKWGP